MKNIVKYAAVMLLLAQSLVAEEEIAIVNKSGEPVNIALVTTTNTSSDKKIAKTSGKVFAKVLGTIDTPEILSNNAYIITENFPRAGTTFGVTNSNRSVWVTPNSSPRSLNTALTQPQGMSTSGVQGKAARVGSDRIITITKKSGKFVVSTSKKDPLYEDLRANVNRAQEMNEITAN